MVERITFRGKLPSELQNMGLSEYTKLIKSRQRRFLTNNPIKYKRLLEKIASERKRGRSKPIRTHAREAVIVPSWIGMTFAVHNGKEFKEFVIDASMLGHRLGEFAYTTKRVQHSAPGIKATKGSKFLSQK
ncbi:MAG: ribosomal protein S19 family protein [Candidatus Marsarchaeota archaeon]|jgi:small subunit ribosomal protein S19|nr:ribosomal protein S19 family protein [Candidatus Marsarchaeota archaeon]